jgi:hypothetical protein
MIFNHHWMLLKKTQFFKKMSDNLQFPTQVCYLTNIAATFADFDPTGP